MRDGRLEEGIGDLNGNWYASPTEIVNARTARATRVPVFRNVPDGRYLAVVRVQADRLAIITVAGVSAQLEGPLHCE
ncbi:MAG: hypothetical protein QOE05_1933 [Actinomycetota bacterium]|nr:hypothetical protein [Actinomycetota bacterium]